MSWLTDAITEKKDLRLLLAIEKVCKEDNLKIPFDKCGPLIAPSVTGNAIIQHLAKLRKKVDAETEDSTDEPTPERTNKPGTQAQAQAQESQDEFIPEEEPDEAPTRKRGRRPKKQLPEPTPKTTRGRAKGNSKGKHPTPAKNHQQDSTLPDTETPSWDNENENETETANANEGEVFVAGNSVFMPTGHGSTSRKNKREIGDDPQGKSKVVVLHVPPKSSNNSQGLSNPSQQSGMFDSEYAPRDSGSRSAAHTRLTNPIGPQANANEAFFDVGTNPSAASMYGLNSLYTSAPINTYGTNMMTAPMSLNTFDQYTPIFPLENQNQDILGMDIMGYDPSYTNFNAGGTGGFDFGMNIGQLTQTNQGTLNQGPPNTPSGRSRHRRTQNALGGAEMFRQNADGRMEVSGVRNTYGFDFPTMPARADNTQQCWGAAAPQQPGAAAQNHREPQRSSQLQRTTNEQGGAHTSLFPDQMAADPLAGDFPFSFLEGLQQDPPTDEQFGGFDQAPADSSADYTSNDQ